MSKKQFDDIEDQIRKAAGVEPPFDEYAWKKMEKLLDRKKDRRRFFLWYLMLFLLMAGIGGFLLFNSNRTSETATVEKQNPSNIDQAAKKEHTGDLPIDNVQEHSITETTAGDQSLTLVPQPVKPLSDDFLKPAISAQVATPQNLSPGDIKNKPGKDINSYAGMKKLILEQNAKTRVTVGGNHPESAPENDQDMKSAGQDSDPVQRSLAKNTFVDQAPVPFKKNEQHVKDSLTENKKVAQEGNQVKDKEKKKRSSNFYFLASLGTDASNVKLLSFRNSAITPRYGFGIGYQLNHKISVETGFYASNKKYAAGPGDYKLKPDPYWNIARMIKIDANCLVYEIPLNIRYNLIEKKGNLLYGTAGLSSYIMKKEEYTYQYTMYNYPYEKSMSFTGNKNLFSVLNFSAGGEKKLSPRVSLQVEPSVHIPLSGVGDGKVKLYSMGVQLGIKYKPGKRH